MRVRFAAVGLAGLLVMSPIASHAQHGGITPGAPQSTSPAMMDMMKRHARMLDESKQATDTLAALVAKMNAETGSAKQDAIAAVVTELARRQTAMHERMMHMHGMMAKMMEQPAPSSPPKDEEQQHKH